MNYVGLDYSIKSPAMCVFDVFDVKRDKNVWPKDVDLFMCKFFGCFEPNLKNENVKHVENLYMGFFNNEWDVEKYYNNAQQFISKTKMSSIFALEGYSYMPTRSRSVISLGECIGILKLELRKLKKEIIIFQPGTIKKFATNDGRAKKEDMINAASEKFKVSMCVYFNLNLNLSLLTDLVDSLWITVFLYTHDCMSRGVELCDDLLERYNRVNFLEKIGD